jgi:hypothetical protein
MNVVDVMAPSVNRVRAYFAPVNRAAKTPTLFDSAQSGGFDLNMPPGPWLDLGWIGGFVRTCGTKIAAVTSGTPPVANLQARSEVGATVSFHFDSWGKLQLALSAGTQQLNLLKTANGAPSTGSGGPAIPAINLAAGSTATVLQMSAADAASFRVGELVVVDVDYAAATGFVGSGVSGAFVKSPLTDVDYVRRVSLNVARIATIHDGAVTLETPLIAGDPVSGMKASGVVGFCDREGSTFFQEWSALFVAEGQQGERVIWHYPRLQAMAGAAEDISKTGAGYEAMRLAANFRALPVVDAVDGEKVVCFRSYVTG